MLGKLADQAAARGVTLSQADIVDVRFTYTDKGRDMEALVADTRKTRPEFLAAQQQLNDTRQADIQQRTEQLRQQGEASLRIIQDDAARQQERQTESMDDFNERMSANDENTRRFSNYIQDESTVLDSSGEEHQVDDSYDRYYLNRNDGTYIGGDTTFDDSSLLGLGLDPSDYEFAPVKP